MQVLARRAIRPASALVFATALATALVATLVAALVLTGCASQGTTGATTQAKPGLRVSAAASLKSVLETLAPDFEKTSNVKLLFNFAASGVLARQIEGGAPADVLLSASKPQVATLVAEGLASSETSVAFAGNRLVILVPAKVSVSARPQTPQGLVGLDKIATGDPVSVPQGAKAEEWLRAVGLSAAVEPHLVFTANAAQTADYVARGEVAAGIGYASDANGRSDIVVTYTVPSGVIKPIRYIGVVLTGASDAAKGQDYLNYLLSPAAQTAFAQAGLVPVADFPEAE